ncbi:MAG: hypothetical protein EXS31_12285 [Pedosphaera sp.]|nr:hypothetical protein [Pedosphaera sp.]
MKLLRAYVFALIVIGLVESVPGAETLTFIAQSAGGVVRESWSDPGNWFHPGPNGLVHINRPPTVDESVFLQTGVNAGGANIQVVNMVAAPGVRISGGNFTLTTLTMLNTATFDGSTLIVTGNLTTDGLAYLDACTLTIDAGATAFISFNAPHTSGSLGLRSNTLINNQGSFIIAGNAALSALGPCRFNNQSNADLRGQGPATVTGGSSVFVFDNRGTVRVEGGTFALENLKWTSSTGTGTFLAAVPGSINLFRNATTVVSNAVAFTFKGPGLHRFTGGLQVDGMMNIGVVDPLTKIVDPGFVELALTLDSVGKGEVHVVAQPAVISSINWKSGHWSLNTLTIDAGGQLLISGTGGNGTSYFDAGRVNNSGSTLLVGNAGFQFGNGVVFNNLPGGLFDVQSDASVPIGSPVVPVFNNQGLFRKSGGAATLQMGAVFNNSGSVQVQGGSVNFQRGYTQTEGNTTVGAGLTLAAGSPGVNIQGGSLSGAGTINGALANSGHVVPGTSPGVLAVGGANSFTQTPGGTLDLEIGGLTPGTQYDQLKISGMATLDGSLNIALLNGFMPVPGDSFPIMTFASRAGTFPVKNGLDLGRGLVLLPVYTTTNLTLVATSVTLIQPPMAVALASGPGQGGQLSWPSLLGQAYQVEFSSDLVQWFVLSNVAATTTATIILDPAPITSVAHRFYRLR